MTPPGKHPRSAGILPAGGADEEARLALVSLRGRQDACPTLAVACRAVLLLLLVCGSIPLRAEEKEKPAPAPRFTIRGLGLLDNRKMARVIRQVHPEDGARRAFDANFVEDAFIILRNRLVADGYLDAAFSATITPVVGEPVRVDWNGVSELVVPRPVEAARIAFEVRRGRLFYYHDFEIEGLAALTEERGRGFFFKEDMLLRLRSSRRFSATQLNRSLSNLREELVNLGHRDAKVAASRVERDAATGRVNVTVTVAEGPLYRVASVTVRMEPDDGAPARVVEPEAPWSPLWEQDFAHGLRAGEHRLGRPDAEAEVRLLRREEKDGAVLAHLEAVVRPGPPVRLGEIRFEGHKTAHTNWLSRLGRVEGPLLDRLAVESARERLSRQGIFNFVGVRYDPPEGDERDVVYELAEGRHVEVSLFAGYGSYDRLFGGVEWNQFNLWGVGHQSRLRGMQSFRTSNVTYTYGIPELLLPGLGVFANVDALRREEVSFERQELKLGAGGRKSIGDTGLQFGLRYSYEFLNAAQPGADFKISPSDFTRVAAVILEGQWDRRDNPLSPRRGQRIYSVVEVANPGLGGDVAYELVEIGASVHVPLFRGLILHGNLQQGVAFADDSATDLPFNKRFFPGGENSVRGYQRGEASPLDAAGNQIGAETYLQGNIELEQFLTGSWSLVAFVDAVGVTPALMDYPADEWLWAVGGGIRWNSIIGPVRLEYGHNMNRRRFDPRGTLHLSIGFPF